MPVNISQEQKLEIYEAYQYRRLLQREIAEKFGITTAQVREILAEVRARKVQQFCEELRTKTPEEMERTALRHHIEQLTHLNQLLLKHVADVQREAKAQVRQAKKDAKGRAASKDIEQPKQRQRCAPSKHCRRRK